MATQKEFQGALPDLGMVTAVYHNHYSYIASTIIFVRSLV